MLCCILCCFPAAQADLTRFRRVIVLWVSTTKRKITISSLKPVGFVHRSQVTIKTLSKFRDVTITEIPERFIDVSMQQTTLYTHCKPADLQSTLNELSASIGKLEAWSRDRGTQRIASVNYLFGRLLIPSDFLERIDTSNFRDMKNLMSVVFGLLKMSFWVPKKGQLSFSERR